VKDFPNLALGDVRRDQRFVTLIENIVKRPGSSIPVQSGSWYDTKAAYSFFQNEEVTVEKLKKITQDYGVSQLTDLQEVLFINDMTNISYNDLQAEGLGYLDPKDGRGIMCYSTLAVSEDGLPLAMIHQTSWVRSLAELGKAAKRKERPFEEKESYKWFEGMKAVNTSVGDTVRKVHIADRGADIYELFFNAYEPNTDLLIRACHDRKLMDGSPLWSSIAQRQAQGTIILEIRDSTGKKQSVEAEVRYDLVEILRPARSKNQYESAELTAIEIRELKKKGDKPQKAGEEENLLCWRLLTSLPVGALTDVLKYIRWYTYRWFIERFHYVLKSGTKIESLQFKKVEALQKAIAVYSLAAFKIMQLVYLSRQYPEASCEVVLTKQQWITLYILIHDDMNIPKQPPSLSQAVKWIGRLGGHLGRKSDGPPGLKTVWLGYRRVCDAANLYETIIAHQNLGKG
jgi:hypothetical protein